MHEKLGVSNLSLISLLLQCRLDMIGVLLPVSVNVVKNRLLVNFELFIFKLNFIILSLEFLHLFTLDFFKQVAFKFPERIFEESQDAIGRIKFVDKLISLLEQPCVNNILKVKSYIVDSVLQSLNFLVFLVDCKLLSLKRHLIVFSPRFKGDFLVFNASAAEFLQDVVDVFHYEDHAWACGQRFDLCAVITHLCEQTLHSCEFVAHIEVQVRVAMVKESCSELLEWMNVVLNLRLSQSEALGK